MFRIILAVLACALLTPASRGAAPTNWLPAVRRGEGAEDDGQCEGPKVRRSKVRSRIGPSERPSDRTLAPPDRTVAPSALRPFAPYAHSALSAFEGSIRAARSDGNIAATIVAARTIATPTT